MAGLFGVFFLGALYLEHVLGYDSIQVGLAFLPLALGIAAMSLGVSARLIERIGARRTLAMSTATPEDSGLVSGLPGAGRI